MLAKGQSILPSVYYGLHPACWCKCGLNTSSPPHSLQRSRAARSSRRTRRWDQKRAYGEVHKNKDLHLHWPRLESPHAVPTPYQIFNQEAGSPYSKHRFYELVKLYHPDRSGHHHGLAGIDSLSQPVRLERYRLVIAANDILSDPIKRSAYDRYGAGWNGRAASKGSRDYEQMRRAWTGPYPRPWRHGPVDHSPSQNATWEDWERWYQRGGRAKQEPLFVANGAFISVVVVLAAFAGVAEAMRFGNQSTSFMHHRDRVHNETSRDLMRRRNEASTFSGRKDERLQSFLRSRDSVEYDIGESSAEGYQRLLPEPEICSSGEVKER